MNVLDEEEFSAAGTVDVPRPDLRRLIARRVDFDLNSEEHSLNAHKEAQQQVNALYYSPNWEPDAVTLVADSYDSTIGLPF